MKVFVCPSLKNAALQSQAGTLHGAGSEMGKWMTVYIPGVWEICYSC